MPVTDPRLPMPDADVLFYPAFFSPEASAGFFQRLRDTVAWEQHVIRLFGREIAVPRLSAWYGEAAYTYSGLTLQPRPWIPDLTAIRERVEQAAGTAFNSVLLNLYRDGSDSMGWHSDNEPELGINPVIASVSFGAVRRFQFRHMHDPGQRLTLDLTPGSLLLMRGPTQHFWKHAVPKTKAACGPRINLTYRAIIPATSS